MAPFDRLALDAVEEPVALAAALLTRASDPQDPAFERALQSQDQRLVELAGLLQQRLLAGKRSYANFQGFGQPQAGGVAGGSPTTPTATPGTTPATTTPQAGAASDRPAPSAPGAPGPGG
ncbi:MAG: hypothetical protein KatS3mg103_0230 [Phycisphaerales bacterium]|nr:MAG: hypothetical protein KatS3mg103_0230 [Phycisphaerales bacterium]